MAIVHGRRLAWVDQYRTACPEPTVEEVEAWLAERRREQVDPKATPPTAEAEEVWREAEREGR